MAVHGILELVLQSASLMQKLEDRALENNIIFYKVYYLAAATSEFHNV